MDSSGVGTGSILGPEQTVVGKPGIDFPGELAAEGDCWGRAHLQDSPLLEVADDVRGYSVGLGSVKGTTGSVLWPWVALAALLEESVPQVSWLWVPRVPRLGQSVPRVPWVRQWAPPLPWLKEWFCELSPCLREWVS